MTTAQPQFSTLPAFLQQLMLEMKAANLIPHLVGGMVRDFYRSGAWSSDIDLEVRCDDLTLQDFLTGSSLVEKFEVLRFGVCRVSLADGECEIAPARKETYNKSLAPSGHSDFEVHFLDQNASDHEAFSRRDFTVNAMGLKLDDHNQLILVDPYNGLHDLKRSLLETVHPEFHRDPLRLPRAVRFSLKYSLEYSSRLIEMFTRMSLENISIKLVLREALKAQNLSFFSELFILVEDCGLKVSKELKPLRFLRQFKSTKPFSDMNEFWLALCLDDNEDIQYHLEQQADSIIHAFHLKQKEASKVLRLMRFLRHEYQEIKQEICGGIDLEQIQLEVKTLIHLMKWLDLKLHQHLIEKYASAEVKQHMQSLIELYEVYDAQLQQVKLNHPSTPKQWEGLALKQALQQSATS